MEKEAEKNQHNKHSGNKEDCVDEDTVMNAKIVTIRVT